MAPRLEIPPITTKDLVVLEAELGCSPALAQVLARRGLTDPSAARAWLAAAEAHDPSAFAGVDGAVALVLRHVAAGTRVTVHGDYDVDGVTSTAILVRCLRALGASVDWYLPSRSEDGYGLNVRTVERLAERGTRLLVTADCGITSVQEVALARSLGLDVVVTDHHTPRADGALPDAPIVHPRVCGYPCEDLCAGGVAFKFAAALRAAAGLAPDDSDLDLVALATVADCVPLHGENRRLVREGLRALATTSKPGLRALMDVSRVDPSRVDAGSIGFRLAPRINAAGRLHRADAGLELLLTPDADRAREIAQELDHANGERRMVEMRILFAAEARVAELGERTAYVLWGEDWHAGVIGIVASRLAERHHRPFVLVAMDGEEGTGSGRSIPAFDLLGGLDACAAHLLRHGGHRAAAGCTIHRSELDAFRARFGEHAEAVLSAEDLVPRRRVDAVVSGDELGVPLAEELAQLEPFGMGNPAPALLVPAARLCDPRPMGEGKHVRFTVEAGGVRARAVLFGSPSLPEEADAGPVDAVFDLELNEWGGAVEPRLLLRAACPAAGEIEVLEPLPGTPEWLAALGAGDACRDRLSCSTVRDDDRSRRGERDRRGLGIAGTIASVVATGEPTLVVCADAVARAQHLRGRVGGFALISWDALEDAPDLADQFTHVVALDPPCSEARERLLVAGDPGAWAHRAWGDPELRYTCDVLARDLLLRDALAGLYRALRGGASVADALPGRPLAHARRLVAVLTELGLVDDALRPVPDAPRTELERSATFRVAVARHEEAQRWLSSRRPVPAPAPAAAAA